jgi:NAD(P)-dependent dehydrogenase (short-subunit alcohol dehydrogenase family)
VTVSLEGRVVAVTSAGHGLGRVHALQLAALGASVVVNDVDAEQAEATAREIGKRAAACVSRVDTARGSFGRIDGLVNNAGFLRDAAFGKMTDDEWCAVIDVHLNGAWHCTRAAWPHLREQGFGHIVLTTSHAALFGNHGQASYAAAKMGLVGLANVLAIEGRRHDIGVNAVAPLAATRLAAGTRGRVEALEHLDPAAVAALVAWLCSPACTDTGTVVAAAGGRFQRYALCEGPLVDLDTGVTVDDVAAAWPSITDVTDPALLTPSSFGALLG